MNQLITPRWEWRTFGAAFDQVDAQLSGERRTSREIYVLCDSSNTNVKIRDDVIEVKVLDRVRHGLELWSPSFKAVFPISRDDIRTVFLQWPLPPPPMSELLYTPQQFITEILSWSPNLHVVGITKARRQAVIDRCLVEVSSVSAGGHTVQTAAVEMADPDHALRMIRTLHLDQLENVSYVTFLKRMLHLRPLPDLNAPPEGASHEHPALPLVRAARVADGDAGVGASARPARG